MLYEKLDPDKIKKKNTQNQNQNKTRVLMSDRIR